MFLSTMMYLLSLFILFTSTSALPSPDSDATPNAVADSSVAGVDQECVLACSHWAVTMGYCRGQFGDLSQQQNITYTNSFLSCLCAGTNSTGTLGSELMADSASFCLGCGTTPKKIKDNLGAAFAWFAWFACSGIIFPWTATMNVKANSPCLVIMPQQFLGLCQVQSSNGTATNATEFMPIGYTTSNDRSKDAVTGSQSRLYHLDMGLLVGLVVGGIWSII
ncbi:hypothetical protein I204_04720 [Kwoniella mangroviensis CBS 8886]|nr:hypothetical protein I204_04720 [Kwoniella mangroviensis CBS 8886]